MQENVAQEIKESLKGLSKLTRAFVSRGKIVINEVKFHVSSLDGDDIQMLNALRSQRVWEDGHLNVEVKRSGTGLTIIITQ